MYYITFHANEKTPESVRNWLKFSPDDGAVALEDVVELCIEFKVSATLRDKQGFLQGSVEESGVYHLV